MISSLQNPKVKDWMRLHQKKYRVSQYLIFDEVLIEEAFKYGYLDTLIYVGSLPFDFANAIEVSEEVMMKLTKDEPKPYIGIAHKLEEKPQEIENKENPEEKAKNIVKENWGEDDSVYYSYDGINSEGKYIICVRDKATTKALYWYYVDIETGAFDIK